MEMEADVLGVRISPPFVEFLDAKAGQLYKASVTVQNISKSGKRLRIHGPLSKLFRLTVLNPDKPVAPGLSLTATVEYSPETDENNRDRLILLSEEDVIEIPVLAFCPTCFLEMDLEVDFGTVVANSKVISKEIEIMNHGSAPGTFKITYKGASPITIVPTSGTVEPETIQKIRVEFCTHQSRTVNEQARVQLQRSEDKVLQIKADVVEQALEVLDPTSEKRLECVWFGPAYFGTSKLQRVVLFNNSPQASDWVAVLQDDAVGAELGTDTEQSTDAALLEMRLGNDIKEVDASAVISCVPNEGKLGPYEKTTISLCFSPVYCRDNGDDTNSAEPAKQDYALFMKFEIVGSKDSFIQHEVNGILPSRDNKRSCVELAITGTGLSVSLIPVPGPCFSFDECHMGERVDVLCVLNNRSTLLPVAFKFRKTANFIISPSKGKIDAGLQQDVMFSFAPHQIGSFKVNQLIDILGQVSVLDSSSIQMTFRPFHQISLSFTGICKPLTRKIQPRFNRGITPAVTNETGQGVEVGTDELAKCSASVRMAVLSATKSNIHTQKRSRSLDRNYLIAFPNDRSASIRPHSRNEHYRSIFTKVERYNYVDPDFAYTEEEERQRKAHKDYYIQFIQNLRETRLQKAKERELADVKDEVDIGIKPAAGLRPRRLSLRDMELEPKEEWPSLRRSRLLTTCTLAAIETQSTSRCVTEGFNVIPSTTQEIEDCSKTLTAQQLHQVIIGPSTVDFGEVCVQSVSSRQLNIVNNLPVHVWVQAEIDCQELQQSSPLSHVVPPFSRALLPFVFETNKLGKFQKSITYTVNKKHTGHVLVLATVIPVALELSTSERVLTPTHSFLAESGYRTTVTLHNRRNHLAEFTWKPIITERGIAFSIRPATGAVEAYKDLECEVVWHPSYFSPQEGHFDLCVHHGNTTRLRCVAKIGRTNVQLTKKHLVFDGVALNFTTVKTAVLQNTGQNHAYFQVLDVYPLPGMMVTPSEGVVPVGGQTELRVHFTPGAVMKFDTRVEIALRNMKSLELRIGGSVEPPEVDINVKSFNFHGVHSGSTHAIPFGLRNKSSNRARVEFDFSKYPDFAIKFGNCPGRNEQPHLYSVEIEGNKVVDCFLIFSPKEVAAYDFNLPVTLNSTGAPSPPPSSIPKTPSLLEKHIVTPRPQTVDVATPSRRVQATALRRLLEMSKSSLEFEIPSALSSLESTSGDINSQTLELKNISQEDLKWKFDMSTVAEEINKGVFNLSLETGTLKPNQSVSITVSFSPAIPGQHRADVPIFLNDDDIHPYTLLSLAGTVKKPRINFVPPCLSLTPVPLDTEATATVSIIPTDYHRDFSIQVDIAEIEQEDGSRTKPFSVHFLQGQDFSVLPGRRNEVLACRISFKSSRPAAFISDVIFMDDDGNRFRLPVAAAADNCLLTAYPYLALHRTDQHIVLKSGYLHDDNGVQTTEAVLHPCYSHSSLSRSTSSSSTFLATNSTSDETLSESVEENPSANGRKKNEEADTKVRVPTPGFLTFPTGDSEEAFFFQAVLKAVQKWFSLFGWPRGPHPITIPQSLRCAVYKVQTSGSADRKTTYQVSHEKHAKTIYDMLLHLSGQMLPGINTSQSLPHDLSKRVLQLHGQHSTLLTFLKLQGACLSYVKPEFLFEPEDFKYWTKLQAQTDNGDEELKRQQAESLYGLDDMSFEALNKRAWTDVLLQMYKVLVLSRVPAINTSHHYEWDNVENIPRINPDPLSSNIYSTSERKLLTWMNSHYEKMRSIVWSDSYSGDKGDGPPSRWIVNFDLDLADGLVLAAVLAAYCPFLISTHFKKMYTHSVSPEQCLHNSLVLVSAFQGISLDIDIQATEISDPNPVLMLMVCVYLYEKLPQYIPKETVYFVGSLHDTIVRQVRLKNPSLKPLVYNATIVGQDSDNFSMHKGSTVIVPSKGQMDVSVQLTSYFLRPMEAMLLFTPRATSGTLGGTLAFSLRSQINNIVPRGTLRCKSPCYEVKKILLKVTNPFSKDAKFRIVLVESRQNLIKGTNSETGHHQDSKHSKLRSTSESGKGLISEDEMNGKGLYLDSDEGNINEFYCPAKSVFLKAGGSDHLEILYLPFHLGKQYCTIILANEQVGELVYSVTGTGDLPLPSPLEAAPSPHVVRVSSAVRKVSVKPVLCFKCSADSCLEEALRVPLVNVAWERALATAAQQRMSSVELERRKITATLQSSSVRAAVAARGCATSQVQPLQPTKPNKTVEYSVEVSMPEHFDIPEKIWLPISGESRVNLHPKTPQTLADCDVVSLPLKFQAKLPGRYLCQIVLRSLRDVRVHLVECMVHGVGTDGELEMVTPALQSVTQDIPLINQTLQDWKLHGVIEGKDFHGPSVIYVRAGERMGYPLMFRPISQCTTLGRLVLQNETDGTEHIFGLKGIGTKPLALDHVVIDCQVRQITQKVLMVPNYTQTRLRCKVVSDMSMISGPPALDIKPGHTVPYPISILPWKRGTHTGVISFVGEDGKQQQPQNDNTGEKADGEQVLQLSREASCTLSDSRETTQAYEVWFSLEVNCSPAPPVSVISVECTVQNSVTVEIPVTNPTKETLRLDVCLLGDDLSGERHLVVSPEESILYQAKFAPAVTGRKTASVIFQSDAVGEFWYELELIADRPLPTTLPECRCELGKWTREFISLVNPTDETLELETFNSNTRNFSVEIDPKRPLIVAPHSTTRVPVQFHPSALGKANHTAWITFKCPQLQEWNFYMSGIGLFPGLMEPLSISTCVGSHSSVIVPFRNPTDDSVLVDVLLTDQEETLHHSIPSVPRQTGGDEVHAFSLPLRQTQDCMSPSLDDITLRASAGSRSLLGISRTLCYHATLILTPNFHDKPLLSSSITSLSLSAPLSSADSAPADPNWNRLHKHRALL
ncbi:cilia- and flagella-associated protein 47-like isoform X2 [Lepisosteus oculatus]|uniref:cilia- and flagella-associated protein 47-like isoform X2 n=1 Tax=Lepisosteus oculatus TaxID=7918 RepID=UPI0035F50670